MMTKQSTLVLFLIACITSSTGCAAWSTYPAIPGAMQIGHPEVEPLPTIMAEAIRYGNERYLNQEQPVFNLPEGVTLSTYDAVKRRLRGGSAMREPEQRAIHVKQIRTRAHNAEVDIVYPRDDGLHHLVTLHMKQRLLNRFDVEHTRLWRIHVEAPQPTYPALKRPKAPEAPETPEVEDVEAAQDDPSADDDA